MDKDRLLRGTGRDLQKRYRRNSAMYGVDWQKDGEAVACWNPECGKKFTMIVRKHHCRSCGKIFCAKCTKTKKLIESSGKVEKVCDLCAVRGGPPLPRNRSQAAQPGVGVWRAADKR